MYQEVERRKGSTRRKSTSDISVCLLNSHYLTGINPLGVLSYVADEDDYTGGGHVVEIHEEPFGELTLVYYCVNHRMAVIAVVMTLCICL